jgi:4-amino-4-deoxy-L-arabinose transferase-like glycosyltransferase
VRLTIDLGAERQLAAPGLRESNWLVRSFELLASAPPAIRYGLPLIGAGLFAALLVAVPVLHPETAGDRAVFGYIGWRILQGELPYRDVWDHKPPAIHYLNALGLLIGRGSIWGIAALQWLALLAAVVLGFLALRRGFSAGPALFASAVWLVGINPVFEGGDLTESFALPLQFAALLLFAAAARARGSVWLWFLTGIVGGVAFALRQNLIGVWLAIVVWVLVEALRTRDLGLVPRVVVPVGLGGLAITGVWLVYFARAGLLADVWADAFVFNFGYSGGGDIRARLSAALLGANALAGSLVFVTGLTGYLLLAFPSDANDEATRERTALQQLLAYGLPIEVILSVASGRVFAHYFITWLPMLALGTVVLASRLRAPATVRSATFLAMALLAAYGPAYELVREARSGSRGQGLQAAAAYVMANTPPGASVLVLWGAPEINLLTNRPAGSRFVFLPPFHPSGFLDEQAQDVLARRPALVVVPPNVPPIDKQARQTWLAKAPGRTADADMQAALDELSGAYQVQATVGADGWEIYAPRNAGQVGT